MGCRPRQQDQAPATSLFSVGKAGASAGDTALLYGMYLMSFEVLMGLSHMTPHQLLLSRQQLTEWSAEVLLGRVIFVSHEWLGYEHPDPAGEQLAALQGLLRRLASGQHTLQSDWRQQAVGSNEKLAAARAARVIPGCAFWMDYSGVPQLLPDDPCREETSRQQLLAIRSIPGYVERSTVVLVLTPTCQHQDSGRTCNFSTWKSRGWCRVEMLCTALSKAQVRILRMVSTSTAPTFTGSADIFQMPPGEGDFTCCARNHVLGTHTVPCDKAVLRRVLEPMLDAAASHHGRMNNWQQQRLLVCDKARVLRGLPEPELGDVAADSARGDALLLLRQRLQWGPGDDAAASAGRAPSLLHWAARSGDTAALRQLLALMPDGLEQPMPLAGPPQWNLMPRLRPLQLAAHSADGQAHAMGALLDAKADPAAWDTSPAGYDALMWAVALGTLEHLQAWFARFPGWDLERRTRTFGLTALMLAAISHGASTSRLRFLVGRGANPRGGAGVVGEVDAPLLAVCAKEESDAEAARLLLEAKCSPRAVCRPTVPRFKAIQLASRLAARLLVAQGRELGPWLQRWVEKGGISAVGAAACSGHVEIVRLLLEAQADPLHRNFMGRTALESARAVLGADLPRSLEALLTTTPLPTTRLQSAPAPAADAETVGSAYRFARV